MKTPSASFGAELAEEGGGRMKHVPFFLILTKLIKLAGQFCPLCPPCAHVHVREKEPEHAAPAKPTPNMSRLQVNCGMGKKETVQVHPNTTLGFVLEEVCKRRKLSPEGYSLKHQRSVLDGALTVRFAGLSSNATIDLVAETAAAVHGECTVALQLESGDRQTAKLSTATTLSQVVEQLAPVALQSLASPSVVYMGRPVPSEDFQTTSLLDLGIGAGSSALLRLGASSAPTALPPAAAGPPVETATVQRPASAPTFTPAPTPAPAPVPTPAPALTAPPALPAVPEDAALRALAPAAAGGAGAASAMGGALEGAMLREMLSEMAQQIAISCPPSTATLLRRYLRNILSEPSEPKFRTIRQNNAAFAQRVGAHPAARALLRLLGFREARAPAAEAAEAAEAAGPELLWVLPPTADLEKLQVLCDLLPDDQPAAAPPQPFPPQPQPPQPQPQPQPPQLQPFSFPAPSTATAAAEAATPSRATITERKVAALRYEKEAPRAEVRVPRQLQLLHPTLRTAPPAAAVPDDFYELTEHDLRQLALTSRGPAAPGSGMQTAAMRELERLKSARSYSHALIRVRLPGELVMQAAFHPLEPVSHVLDEVAALLSAEARLRPFHLFTTPPRTVLRPELSLTQAGLVPAATAILAWDAPLPAHLASLPPASLIDAEALGRLGGARPSDEATLAFPNVKGARVEAAAAGGGGGAAAGARPAGAAGAAGEAEAEASGSKPKGKGPKWMKL